MSSDLATSTRAAQRIVDVDMYSNSDPSRPLAVPGFGYNVDEELDDQMRFRHGVDDFRQERLVAREIAMLALMDAITDKPNWEAKVSDQAIVAKWREEALGMKLISEKAWEWCLREVREKAEFAGKFGFVRAFDSGSGCAKSDGTVDAGLRDELIAGVRPLLEVEEEAKDWHPSSNEQVLNLVHPSLFPLVYGQTQVVEHKLVGLLNCLDLCGQGDVPAEQIPEVRPDLYGGHWNHPNHEEVQFSSRFQWLPAEVKFQGESGINVEITSYINNLFPAHHRGLYSTIARFISKAIPMWNEVLVTGYNGRIPPRIKVNGAEVEPEDEPNDLIVGDYHDPSGESFNLKASLAKVMGYIALPDNPEYRIEDGWEDQDDKFSNDDWIEDADIDDLHEAIEWKYKRVRKILHPEPGDSISFDEWKCGKSAGKKRDVTGFYSSVPVLDHEYHEVHLEQDFRSQGLQVIVKLASIELSPEKPDYRGGDWHLEGMVNEHIVATAIYYYDVDNVTESRIDFRMEATLDDDLNYPQSDHTPLATIFGTESMRDEPAVQNLGSMLCREGRMLAFPNTLQHRVQPFKLADHSRAGHRRFLVLWLVDPHYRILSTANVPPQQHHWVAAETIDKVLTGRDLAVELEDMIKEYTNDYPMSLETAKALRLELMKERSKLMPTVEGKFDHYNLCEH